MNAGRSLLPEQHKSADQPRNEDIDLTGIQEEVWSGYRTRRRTTVEEVEDEDSRTSDEESGEVDMAEISELSSRDGDSDNDEFTAVSVWDELAEGVLRAIGCSTGASHVYAMIVCTF